jgi:regulator of sigma E protease
MDILQYVFALVVTLGVLVTVHELGHFLMARAAGAHVVRFCIGFGPVIASRFDRRGTEYAVAVVPLGGYVRILDEREDEIPPGLEARTFNRLSAWWRIGFALGGPAANFVLAFVVYWGLFVAGSTDVVPIIAAPAAETPAAQAGLAPNTEIVSIDGTPTATWADISMALAARLGDSGRIDVVTRSPGSSLQQTRQLRIKDWQRGVDEPDLFGSLGLVPTLPAVLGEVLDEGPAHAAGLQHWDRVISVDGRPISSWGEWVDVLRAAPAQTLRVEIERDGSQRTVSLTPQARDAGDGTRYGYVGVAPLMREVNHGVLEALPLGLHETAAKTALTFELLSKMVTGLVSTRNLSGPITIAKVAGDSARSGWRSFFAVLALLSISLGVLNLLPIPILDGGHVLFYATELVIGRPVPDRIQALGMQVGLAIVGGMMLLAFYNDITRLF